MRLLSPGGNQRSADRNELVMAALAGEALPTHGGIGFTWEHDLHLYPRRAKVSEGLYGAAAEHYERLVALRE